jgi:hypothetical protein
MAPIAPSPAGPGGGDGDNGFDRASPDDPAALASFYGALLEVEPQPGLSPSHWRLPWPAGGWLEVYGPSRSRPQPQQLGRLGLCLQRQAHATGTLAMLQAWIATALDLGVRAGEPPRRESFGAEAGCWTRRPTACCCLWCLPREGDRQSGDAADVPGQAAQPAQHQQARGGDPAADYP